MTMTTEELADQLFEVLQRTDLSEDTRRSTIVHFLSSTESTDAPVRDSSDFWRCIRVPTVEERNQHMLKRLSRLAELAVHPDIQTAVEARHQMILVWGDAGWVHLAEYALMNLVDSAVAYGWSYAPLVEGYLDLLASWVFRHAHALGAALCAVRAFYGLSTGVPLCLLVGLSFSEEQDLLTSVPSDVLSTVSEQVKLLTADLICGLEAYRAMHRDSPDDPVILGCMKLLSGDCDIDNLALLPEDIAALVGTLAALDADAVQPDSVEIKT